MNLAPDRFIAAIALDPAKLVLVFRRQYAGRTHVRWRVWHKSRRYGRWYPDRRRWGSVPVEAAAELSEALRAAAEDRQLSEAPAWLEKAQASLDRWAPLLQTLGAPPRLVRQALHRAARGLST
jgi:hypothetical protein